METVTPDLKYSTLGPRFLAGIVDGLIFVPLVMLSTLIFSQQIVWLTVAWIPIAYSVGWLYSVVGHAVYGKTVGKHVMKVIVLDNKTESRITWTQALLRDSFFILLNTVGVFTDIYVIANQLTEVPYAIWMVSIALEYGSLSWFLIEIVTCATNAKSRALHDFIAGTVVVRTDP